MPMKSLRTVAAFAALAAFSSAASAASPFEAFKGKVKEGLYEYKMDMDMGNMPGMPPGMGKQSHTMQNCVTAKDIDGGGFARGGDPRKPDACEVKNFNMSGNSATYTMECKGDPAIKADSRINFTGDGFNMDIKSAMTQGGQTMNMTQKVNARYIGPCKK
jgi:hypothetical protein